MIRKERDTYGSGVYTRVRFPSVGEAEAVVTTPLGLVQVDIWEGRDYPKHPDRRVQCVRLRTATADGWTITERQVRSASHRLQLTSRSIARIAHRWIREHSA